MIAMAAVWIGLLLWLPKEGSSQIPTVCSTASHLTNMTCCPDDCGQAEGHGQCEDIPLPSTFSMASTDVRHNWPHYFTRACKCSGNYYGVDCSRCKYGYFGDNCEQKQVLARKSVQDLTAAEWSDYAEILKMARSYNSGYIVVLSETQPGTADLETADIDLYDFFVWQHHYSSKDNPGM